MKASGGFVDYPAAWFSEDTTNILLAENGCVSTDQILFDFRSSDQNISSVENEVTIEKKINGLMQFHRWFFPFLANLVADQQSVEKQLPNVVRSNVFYYVKSMALDFVLSMGWSKALRYIRLLSTIGVLGKRNTFYQYIRLKITGNRP